MLTTEDAEFDEAVAPDREGAVAAVRETFAAFRVDALAAEARAAELLAASRKGTVPPGDTLAVVERALQLAEGTLRLAEDADGLNGALRVADMLDAAEAGFRKIQAVIDKTLPLFREYGYQPPFDLPPSPQPQTAVAEPKTPTNLFSPPPPKSAHLPDTPVAGGRESNASASTMSAPRTPAVLKEFRRVEEETWEDSPSMETLAGGLSQKGLEILREGSLGAPGTPDHRQYQEPEAPPTVSPPREAHYEEMGEPVARLPTAQDAEPTAATIPAALGDFDAASPSSPDYRRADSDEMEDTFANLNLQHDFPIARGREPPSVPRGRPSFYQADDIDNTFSSLPPRPHVPATPHTTSRIPVLTPRAPVSDSLYPLLAPISEEEYEDAMDAFGRRATPLDWLNECVAQVNEALTDVRFDMADDGAASEWREVTVKELEVMLDMPEGKCMGFVAACLKLNRLAPATKKGQKAYRIIE